MRSFWLLLLGFLGAAPLVAQQPIRFTHPVDILNLTNCLAQPGARPVPLQADDLNLEINDWSTSAQAEPFTGVFTLELKEPTLVGSVFVEEAEAVEYRTTEWKAINPGPEKGRPLQMLPIPAGDVIQTLRFRVKAKPFQEGDKTEYRARLPFLTIIPLRLLNVAAEATVTASSLPAGGASPAVLVDGVVARDHNFSTAPRETETSEASPEWVLLTWPKAQSVRGICLLRGSEESGFGHSVAEVFKGEGDPAMAMDRPEMWEKMNGRVTAPGKFRAHQLFVTPESTDTRGLRIRSLGSVKQLSLGELMILSDLGYAPGPVTASELKADSPEAAEAPKKSDEGK